MRPGLARRACCRQQQWAGARNDDALALPGTSPMTHGGRAKPGYVWLHDDQLSDDATRARLTGWALDCVRDLPPKE